MSTLLLAVYVALNLFAFMMFLWDKRKAQKDEWRTKESTLLLCALFGPFGATLGMQVARHKTRKLKFKLVYLFLLVHIAVIAYMIVF